MIPAPSGLKGVDGLNHLLEILILADVLFGYVFFDHLVCHVPTAAAEIPSRAQMPPPELLLDVLKFRHQVVRRLPLLTIATTG